MTGTNETPAVAAICKCGAAVFLGVRLNMDDDAKREIGELAADGYEIKRMPITQARQTPFGCRCDKEKSASAGETAQ